MDAKRLAARRKQMRLTQRKLAEWLGVHPITVAKWEAGMRGIPADVAERMELNGRLSRKMRDLKGRAYVTFINGQPTAEEALRIEDALYAEFNDDEMVGSVDILLSREPEGWRVTSAGASSGVFDRPGAEPTDWRPQVIAALRRGGVPLSHEA